MGEFYGNIHVRTRDRDMVVAALKPIARRGRKFLVRAETNGWVAICPNDYGQDEKVSRTVAKRIASDVVHLLLHDSDLFCYWYYRNGKLIDKYNSHPDYFGPVAERIRRGLKGRPQQLAELLSPGNNLEQLRMLLDEMRVTPSLAGSDRPRRFAALLGIVDFETSYEYLMADEMEGAKDRKMFVHLPDLGPELLRRRRLEADLTRQMGRLRDDRVLLLEIQKERDAPRLRADAWRLDTRYSRLLVMWERIAPRLAQGPPPTLVESYRAPWAETPDETLEIEPSACALEISRTGRLLASVHALSAVKIAVVVRDRDARAIVFRMERRSAADCCWLRFAADERTLYVIAGGELIVCDLQEGKQVASHPWQAETAALHPHGEWAVGGGQFGMSLINLLTGAVSPLMPVGFHEQREQGQRLLAKMSDDLRTLGVDGALRKLIDEHVQAQLKLMETVRAEPEGRRAIEAIERRGNLEQTIRSEFESYVPLYKSLLAGTLPGSASPRRSEHVRQLEFTSDGRKLLCAATEGMRVFSWDELLGATSCVPPAALAVDSELIPDEYGIGHAVTYALAFDAVRNRVLFSGLEGKIQFFELETGAMGTLIELPGRPAAADLALSGDNALLACSCTRGLLDGLESGPVPTIQVWDYARLCARIEELR